MVFVYDRGFLTIGNITYSQWCGVMQQHQSKVDEWSLVIRLSEWILNP